MKHNIYLIEATNEAHQPYDSYDSFVIIADKPEEARMLCDVGDEGAKTWLFKTYSTVKKIGESDEPKGVVLGSYNAG